MVENWEIEWNSSMMEHGPDLGTAEFIFAKGGNLADFNYVMFGVNDSTYEPLIKAVAERDNTHPDLIRKNVVPLPQTQPQQRALAAPQRPGIAVDQQTVVGANPRAVRRFNQAVDARQRGEAVRGGSRNVGDLYGAGFRGQAAMQGVRNVMGAAGAGLAAAGRRAGPALGAAGQAAGAAGRAVGRGVGRGAQRMMQSGAAQRMGQFMGNLRHIPEAARGAMQDRRERRLDENRERMLQQRAGRAQASIGSLSRRTDTNTRARDSMRDDAEREFAAASKELGEVQQRLGGERPSLAQRVADIGRERRGQQRTRAQQAAQEEEAAGRIQERADAASEDLPEDPEDAITPDPEERTMRTLEFDDSEDEGPVEDAPPDTGAVAPRPSPAVEVQTPDPRIARFDELAARPEGGEGYGPSSIGGRTSSYSKFRDRLMQQGINPDDPSTITQEALDAANIPKSKAANAFIERLRQLNPALVEAAAQGDTAAAQEIEEAAEDAGVMEEGGVGGDFAFSEDKHIASWDSLLKGLNIR